MNSTLDRVKALSDRDAIALYDRTSRAILSGTTPTQLDQLGKEAMEKFDVDVTAAEEAEVPTEVALPFIREWLEAGAQDPTISPVIENFLNNPSKTFGVAIVLSLGAVLLTTLVSSSIKAEFKNGKWYFSYSGEHISDNTVKIVNKFFSILPDAIKRLVVLK